MRWLITFGVLEHLTIIVAFIFIIACAQIAGYASVNSYIETNCFLDSSTTFKEIDSVGISHYGKVEAYAMIDGIRYNVLLKYPASPVWTFPWSYQTISGWINDIQNSTHCYVSSNIMIYDKSIAIMEKPMIWLPILIVIFSVIWISIVMTVVFYYIFRKNKQLEGYLYKLFCRGDSKIIVDL